MTVVVRGVPLIHGFEMLWITVNDEMRSFLLVLQFLVGKYAREFEYSIFERIKTTHFKINPKQPGPKR